MSHSRGIRVLVAIIYFLVWCYIAVKANPSVADAWYQSTRCSEMSTTDACTNYERCKSTHRCARGDEDYYVKETRHESYTRLFAGGTRSRIPLMNDFEDWKSGMNGWTMNSTAPNPTPPPAVEPPPSATRTVLGWDTYDFKVIGSLELADGYVLFDTDTAQISGDVTLQGVIQSTRSGTKVAIFNFMTVYLGKNVRVRCQGSLALSVMSRSSMIIDTTLPIRPGTLGGFPGGGLIGTGLRNNNQNGPGSASVRVYVSTVSTYGTHVPEIQEIEITATSGQRIQGTFTITLMSQSTQPISYDATSYDVQEAIEAAFPHSGKIAVERDPNQWTAPEVGRRWRITFLTAVGNVPQVYVTSHLDGLGARVVSRTIREGNALSGTFTLSWGNFKTRPLASDASADDVRQALIEDIPVLLDAQVERTDATSTCLQGSTLPDQTASSTISASTPTELFTPSEWMVPTQRLSSIEKQEDSNKNIGDQRCSSGRGAANGFVWKLTYWSTMDNVAAESPSSLTYHQASLPTSLTVNGTLLTGLGAAVEAVTSQCFSLAFGGSGASSSKTGVGGKGYATWTRPLDTSRLYTSDHLTDLVGGSGGSGGGLKPVDVFPMVQPIRGGAGGGAIHLRSVNDLLLGPNAQVAVNGASGMSGFTAGGGGSGGSILIESGGSIAHHGLLSSVGGHGGASWNVNQATSSMPGGGGSGGRVAVFAESFSTWGTGVVSVSGGTSQSLERVGSRGSLMIKVATALSIRIDPTIGAAGTAKSLLVVGSEADQSLDTTHQVSRNGPRFWFSLPTLYPIRPERISYFVRIDGVADGMLGVSRGALFGVHSSQANDGNNNHFLVAIAIVDGSFVHGANVFDLPQTGFYPNVHSKVWYKVDVLLRWDVFTYSIQLNDVLLVRNVSFGEGTLGIDSVSVNSLHSMSTWWDEIYVGENHIETFKCPTIKMNSLTQEGVVVVNKRILRKLWKATTQGPPTSYHLMERHTSHLSEREMYKFNNGGLIPMDGAPHRSFLNDVRETESEIDDGSSEEDSNTDEIVSTSEMLTMEDMGQDSTIILPLEFGEELNKGSDLSGVPPGPTMYWYSEIYEPTTGFGAVGACSTRDFITWRNEGLMFRFNNLTDPFGSNLNISLLADRPKVVYNKQTHMFVMWMHVDIPTNTMGLSGTATSPFPNGPFVFVRSFYPDSPLESPGGVSLNETHDQTIAIIPSPPGTTQPDRAYLLRTYYKTIEYWLPRAVMNPLWQSVQDANGSTQFGLSFHRAYYHEGYDDPNDIYLQRWRMEDSSWSIQCCSPTDTSHCVLVTTIPDDPSNVCPDDMDMKKAVLGQSQMTDASRHIRSRYKDPLDPVNNYFIPHSVQSHTSWGFPVYNIKTWQGNYFDALSTNITLFLFHRFAGERRRIEIESNTSILYEYPNEELQLAYIPSNDTSIMDLLLGTLGVPMSASFRAKYSSFDIAEIDLNNDGKITAYEIATLTQRGNSSSSTRTKLSATLVQALTADFELMKAAEVIALDPNQDGQITLQEFVAWVGVDPNLLFDRFDLDKSGYLDENELARLLWYRQIPRLDAMMIFLDPSFDGRVYYPRFREQLLNAPQYIFDVYDVDQSGTLTVNEIDYMKTDLGEFALPTVLDGLKRSTTQSIAKEDYVAWLSATTSVIGDARNELKIDNAPHATRPDTLTGPMHVVERRRAKYVAISQLRDDFMSTNGLLREVEGDFEGREALISYFAKTEQLFGLEEHELGVSIPEEDRVGIVPFRQFLSSDAFGERASYWNGRHWEGRPSAPTMFTYGTQCMQYAGTTDTGCLPCLTHSPYISPVVDQYQSEARSMAHCQPYKELDAYIKAFDQQVSIQLQYQQQAQYGPQGLQPHLSPCFNQSQFFPCDVQKVFDGNIGDALRDMTVRDTLWNLAWENHPNNVGSSQKIRTDDHQLASFGPSYIERFPKRERNGVVMDTNKTLLPDEMIDHLGGGS